MHHIKPTSKGDPLCPLGFHPQVRWPTRCKRCFRDYKEHGNRNRDQDAQIRRDELTVSTPALSTYSSRSRDEPTIPGNTIGSRTWTSSSNLSASSSLGRTENTLSENSSWTSSPNLADTKKDDLVSVSFTLPRRRRVVEEPPPKEEVVRRRRVPEEESKKDDCNDDSRKTQYTVRRRTSPGLPSSAEPPQSRSAAYTSGTSTQDGFYRSRSERAEVERRNNDSDVDFMLRVKPPPQGRDVTQAPSTQVTSKDKKTAKDKDSRSDSSSGSDEESVAGTETTETTLVNPHEQQLQEEIDNLKSDLEAMKIRCEKAERDKSDILLRRLATYETTTSKTTASEVLKLQQKCNELKTTVEDLRDEKKVLTLKVRETEAELEALKATDWRKQAHILSDKLTAAETLCEELMEENEDMKKEMRDMEEEMVEMQDNFREDQADEYSSMKKELEQTTKNCRILSFKLRKAERKVEQLEAEKMEAERKLREIAGGQMGLDKAERIRQLEHELSVANEAASRLQKDLEDATKKQKNDSQDVVPGKKKTPMLGSLPKTPSGEKVSRASLTRGGSQEDPVQLLRDLQDSLEREADLREQMRQAEEEAQSLQKKVSRIEDDNESLLLQLKKMATKAKTRRLSPTPPRLEPIEKDEGISDEEDPAELRLQLELNEQEAAVLRRKVEELESEGDLLKRKVKDLQDKLATSKTAETKPVTMKKSSTKTSTLYEQKMKVMDDEMSELRKKLIEKDRECERLHAEMSIGVKKPKILQKSKSLDGDQQTIDLKRQLQLVETEASVLRTRIQGLEVDNEKLQAENKKLSLVKATKRAGSAERTAGDDDRGRIATLEKQLEESKNKIKELEKNNTTPGLKKETVVAVGENEKLKNQLKKMETEKKKLEESLNRLKESALSDVINFYKKRTPRTPTDITTKLQMKRMLEESEKEIGELIVLLKKSEGEKSALSAEKGGDKEETESMKDELEKTKWKLQLMINQQEEEYQKRDKEKDNLRKETEEERNKLKKEVEKFKTQLEKEKQKVEEAKKDLEKQKKTYTDEIASLKEDIKKTKVSMVEITDLKGKLEKFNTELSEEKKQSESLKKQLEESAKIDSERKQLKKEIEDSRKKQEEADKKVKELEEKLKKSEKLANMKKDKISMLEKESEMSSSKTAELEKERDEAVKKHQETAVKLQAAEERMTKLEKEIATKNSSIEQLENSIRGEKASELKQRINDQVAAAKEMTRLQEELKSSTAKIQEMEKQIEMKEKERKEVEDSAAENEKRLNKDIEHWEKKASELEMDLQAERKMMERLKSTQEKELKSKDLELAQLRSKSGSAGAKKLAEVKQEMQAQIDRLEVALASEKRGYDELTAKYEQLEEEHVVMKAQLVKEKEKLHSQLLNTERGLVETEADLKSLRETFNNKQDAWIKEKLIMQEKMKEVEVTIEKWQIERARLQSICEGRQSELEQLRKESQALSSQSDSIRKDNEELRKQIEDYEKVAKIHRMVTAEKAALEKELGEVKAKLVAEEKVRKSDISALKLRYENRVSVISREVESTQGQLSRFKKERDAFKHMLETAQKTIADLKLANQQHGAQQNRLSYDGEDSKEQVALLEQQVSCLEDELSESRVEASRLRTELVSERSAWEVQFSELTSRLNEMEEEKILSSGRTKITGLKTKMELAWQKEREEQHRILQETATLARDLRQTLFEVERERDKERLEAKRRLDQQRKSAEEEHEEIRKKLNEMQCDLLELRDAHAKLRTTNEKLRREKERWERERDMLRQSLAAKKRVEQDDERTIISVAQLVQELTVLAPDLFPSKPRQPAVLPTPPTRRKGSKSRETSPALERKDYSRESSVGRDDTKSQEVQEIMTRLTEAAHQLRRHKRAVEERQSARKAFASTRSASTESDGGVDGRVKKDVSTKKGTLRKSLSLEQTSAQEQQAIWKYEDDHEGSVASVQSLDELDQIHALHRRDPSLDSRLSGGSTKSEMLPSTLEKKKKSSLFGKLKKLTKSSKSVDRNLDGSDLGSTGQLDIGSDTSLSTIDEKGSRPFKDKLSSMFRKSGSTSRGNSLERNLKPPSGFPTDSMQRPLVSSGLSNSSEVSNSSKSAAKRPPSSAPVQRKAKK